MMTVSFTKQASKQACGSPSRHATPLSVCFVCLHALTSLASGRMYGERNLSPKRAFFLALSPVRKTSTKNERSYLMWNRVLFHAMMALMKPQFPHPNSK